MNLPEPISYFMTSSCWSCLSISEQVINIKMKFFCMSYQKPPISIVFTNVFSCKEWMPLHQSFIKSNLVLISVLSEKVFSLSFVIFFFFLAEGTWISFYTWLWLHLHQSGNKKVYVKDISWPWRTPNSRNICAWYQQSRKASVHIYMNVQIFLLTGNSCISKHF